MRARNVILAVVLVAVSVAIGALARPLVIEAQSAAGTERDMEAGPSGMWIMRGDRIYLCAPDPVSRGNTPSAPVCSAGTTLQR